MAGSSVGQLTMAIALPREKGLQQAARLSAWSQCVPAVPETKMVQLSWGTAVWTLAVAGCVCSELSTLRGDKERNVKLQMCGAGV